MNDLSEDIQSEFPSFNIDNATKENIVSDECFNYIFGFENFAKINDLIQKAREKAINFGCETKFNKKYKIYRDRYIKYMKSKDSLETDFSFNEDKKFKFHMKLKCKQWIANQTDGVYKNEYMKDGQDLKMIKNYASPIPIFVAERLVNTEENMEKVRIAFYKDQKWQSVITEKNTISTKNKIILLGNLGIEVNENNAKSLITYFADLLAENEFTPRQAITHMGWAKNKEDKPIFLPYDSNTVFDGEINFREIYNSITKAGDYNKWLELMKELRKNKIIKFMMASSFASPLIKLLGINSYIVELWGITGTAKTVALMIAMSIWGNPTMGKLTRSLNGTNVAITRMASFLNSIPFAGDELQAIKSKWNNNFDNLIMLLTEQIDRSRGQQFGGLEKLGSWNCNFLFTGEEKMTKLNSFGGAKNRVIEVEVKEKIVEDGNYVCNIIKENYGWAGQAYIEKLLEIDKEVLQERYRKHFKDIIDNENTSDKQAMAMASIILASEISSKYIFNDNPLKIEDVKEWLKGNEEIDQAERAYDWTTEWIAQNISKFNGENRHEIWGKIIFNGFRALIIKKVYVEELEKAGFDFNAIKNRFAEKEYLEKYNNRFDKTARIEGTVARCIELILRSESDIEVDLKVTKETTDNQ